MSAFLIIDRETKELYSSGTVVAKKLPKNLRKKAITDEEYDDLMNNRVRWDKTKLVPVVIEEVEKPVDHVAVILQAAAALQAQAQGGS